MVNKCAAPECRTGYESVRLRQLAIFHFPLKKIELAKNSVFCELHFEERLMIRRKKCNLSWSINPTLTVHSTELAKTLSFLLVRQTSKQLPRKRVFQEEELERFCSEDSGNYFTNLNESFLTI